MKRIFGFLFLSVLFSCDDGDVFVSDFNFDAPLQYCEVNELLIYKINQASNQSISVKLPLVAKEYLITSGSNQVALGESNSLNYRSYDGDPSAVFCSALPVSSPVLVSEEIAENGVVNFFTTMGVDDVDGVPAIFEGRDPNGDGDFSDALDTDGDGVPNYMDSDDDGDNVPTNQEGVDPNGDGDFSDALDTDGDGIPNYLDSDDDGDGVLTRFEDADMDVDPTNDITNIDVGADYLNSSIVQSYPITLNVMHQKKENFECIITVQDMLIVNSSQELETLQENFSLGILSTEGDLVEYEILN